MTDHPYRHRDECRECRHDVWVTQDRAGTIRYYCDGHIVAIVMDGAAYLCDGACEAGFDVRDTVVSEETVAE